MEDKMGLFRKAEVEILKESNSAQEYLEKLEVLSTKVQGDFKDEIMKEITITKAGIFGENNILFELKNSDLDMFILQDIYIENENGDGAQIDFIAVTPKITFLIECKNLFGNIEIDKNDAFIRTIEYNGKKYKEGIYSPITQNERHMKILRDVISNKKNFLQGMAVRGAFNIFYKSLVVLANPKTVVFDRYAKKEIKEQVIRADQLINTIKRIHSESKSLPSSRNEMKSIAEGLLSRNIEERKDYYEKYAAYEKETAKETLEGTEKSVANNADSKKICPKCGKNLVLREAKTGKFAGNKFYGCIGYPACKYIENMNC